MSWNSTFRFSTNWNAKKPKMRQIGSQSTDIDNSNLYSKNCSSACTLLVRFVSFLVSAYTFQRIICDQKNSCLSMCNSIKKEWNQLSTKIFQKISIGGYYCQFTWEISDFLLYNFLQNLKMSALYQCECSNSNY